MSPLQNLALNKALLLATKGIPCFPCSGNKRPTCPNGYKDATVDQEKLIELWGKSPGELIGVPTGARWGVDVLDVDPQNGGDEWRAAFANVIPITRTHLTRNNGYHFLFKHHDGIRNSAGKIAPGVDVRGEGGYIIWWPAKDLPTVNEERIAEWPQWLLDILLPNSPKPQQWQGPARYTNRTVEEMLMRSMINLMSAPAGTRNDQLNREAYILGKMLQRGEIDPLHLAVALSQAALVVGLDRSEVINTLTSALRASGV